MDESLGLLEAFPAIAVLAIGIFIFIWFVLWVLLPFAVFGIKERLDKQIGQTKRTNELLLSLREAIEELELDRDL